MSDVLQRLAAALRERGGLLAAIAVDPRPGDGAAAARHGPLAAAGPRARPHAERYELLVEAIREGYLLHYDKGRVVRSGDRDLILLAGDQLYALGLAELAELGDLEAVATLAAVIALGAQARVAGDRELAEAVWDAGVHAVARGATEPALESSPALAAACAGERAARARALAALREAAARAEPSAAARG